MSNWEDEDPVEQPPLLFIPTQPKAQWDDEEDDDVKDSWDALYEEEPEESKKPSTPEPKTKPQSKSTTSSTLPPSTKTKNGPLASKKLVLQLEPSQQEEELPEETPAERKLRLKKAVIQSDEKNITDLFNGINLKDSDKNSPDLPSVFFSSEVEVTNEYLDMLSSKILDHFAHLEQHGLYTLFLENLIKSLCDRLRIDDIRKMSSVLNTLANEKHRKEKEPGKKKKAVGKKQIKVSASNYDMEEYNEYDDFM